MIQNLLCFTSGLVNALTIIDMGILANQNTSIKSFVSAGETKRFVAWL